jgi:PAS domain-containing protein
MVLDWIAVVTVCLATASAVVWWLSPRVETRGHRHGHLADGTGRQPVFLFDGDRLIDWSSAARPLVRLHRGQLSWPQLRQYLSAQFAGLPASLTHLKDSGPLFLSGGSEGKNGAVICEWLDGTARVQLVSPESQHIAGPSQELENLRAATDGAPNPVWRLSSTGEIVWANRAYELLQKKLGIADADGATPLFPELPPSAIGKAKSRVPVPVPNSAQKLWFDVSVVETVDGTMCYATDINAIVDAEIAQRNFVQTLAKTFAQLPIGLAIFDRNRQLALFNPALIDLTALQADFLSSRPTLFAFFDRLRDRRMMPEPKNYSDWRQQINDLFQAANDGRYQETWTLPSGAVYSISGRPHPDGAVAFLFEDITADVTLTRRFRAELELSQSIIDNLDQGIAVFSADGIMAHNNVVYRDLWGCDPDMGFGQVTILDACRAWQSKSTATPIWGELRDFVATRENREAWSAQVWMKAGYPVRCSVHPIQTGATLVSFSILEAAQSEPKNERSEVSLA